MTTLLVQEITSELSQEFTLNLNQRYMVGAFSPYLYLHNAPAGTFTITVTKDAETIFTQDFTSAQILDELGTLNNYTHVFYPFLPDFPILMSKGNFTVTISTAAYTYSNSSFIGWVQQHENLNNSMDYTPVTDSENTLAMRMKIYKQGILL